MFIDTFQTFIFGKIALPHLKVLLNDTHNPFNSYRTKLTFTTIGAPQLYLKFHLGNMPFYQMHYILPE